MPAEIQTGTATIQGITNGGSAISMTGYATFILDTVKAAHKFRLKEVVDENDADVNLTATNPMIETDIAWKPSGATRAAAAATAVFLTPLSGVTLANFKVTAFNGRWIYVGDESIDLSASGPAVMSLKIRKYDDTTQNASMATVISG